MSERIVIIGAGQAAAQAAQSLRAEGFAGTIVMLGDEPYWPYQRPPLSKKFLAGEMELERLFIRPAEFYAEARIDARLNESAARIDRAEHRVVTKSGEAIPYDQLLIATGSRVRRLDMKGAALKGIHYLRGVDDVRGIQADFKPGAKMVIVGAGYIGLEVAAVAVKRGIAVTVLEMAPRVMARVVSEPISAFFDRTHRAAGVDIELGLGVEGFEGEDRVTGVRAGGTRFAADAVIVGVGILPNVELARDAGLPCENGIVVDDCARTADAAIFAAGDCTNHPNALLGKRLRLESVQNAIDQAKAAAAAMCGKPKPYAEVPWFWSDQYEYKLQIAGLIEPGDTQVVRGDPASGKFANFHLRGGAIAAVECVNAAPEFMMGRQLIAKKAAVAPERLGDVNIPMKQLLA